MLAEIKRASFALFGRFRPIEIAKQYESAGAARISMLTDRPTLEEASRSFNPSVIRLDSRPSQGLSDSPNQVDEAYLAGADAVLLIVAMLGKTNSRHS